MPIKKLDLLIALYITCIVVSELMGSKTTPLFQIFGFQLNASVALLTLPIIFTINDIILEVYGVTRAKSIARSGILMVIFIMLFALIATALPSSTKFTNSEIHYDFIFQSSLRLSAASLMAFTIAEFTDILIFSKLRKRFGASKLWLRNNVSNWIAQLIDTTIFITLAFYEISNSPTQNFNFLLGIILPYWLLKCFMSVIETPFVYWGIRWLRK